MHRRKAGEASRTGERREASRTGEGEGEASSADEGKRKRGIPHRGLQEGAW